MCFRTGNCSMFSVWPYSQKSKGLQQTKSNKTSGFSNDTAHIIHLDHNYSITSKCVWTTETALRFLLLWFMRILGRAPKELMPWQQSESKLFERLPSLGLFWTWSWSTKKNTARRTSMARGFFLDGNESHNSPLLFTDKCWNISGYDISIHQEVSLVKISINKTVVKLYYFYSFSVSIFLQVNLELLCYGHLLSSHLEVDRLITLIIGHFWIIKTISEYLAD